MEKLIALKHKLDAIKTMGTNAKKEALPKNVSEIKNDAWLDDSFFGCGLRHRNSGDAQLHQRLREARADGKTWPRIPHHRHY